MKIAKLVSHKDGVIMEVEYEVNDGQIEGFLNFGGINILKFDISKFSKRVIPTTEFVNLAKPTKNTMDAFISEIANIELDAKFKYRKNLLAKLYIQTSLNFSYE